MTTTETIHIAFGLDREKKPRAARVPAQDLEVALKAAATMGLRVGRITSPEAVKLAKALPEVRLFATGKGLVPLAKKAIYEGLEKAVAVIDPPPPSKAPTVVISETSATPPAKSTTSPTGAVSASPKSKDKADTSRKPWEDIGVGSTVLWTVDPKEGWYPCKVTAVIGDGRRIRCSWVGFKGFPQFEIDRFAAGLYPIR